MAPTIVNTQYRVVSFSKPNANFSEGDFAAMQVEVVSRVRVEGAEFVQWYYVAIDNFGQENSFSGVMPTDEQVAAMS